MDTLISRLRTPHLFIICLVSTAMFVSLTTTLGFAHALTQIDGTISTDTEWTLAGSPYVINNGVFVANGATLTIDPGVVVKIAFGGQFLIQGSLVAHGTQTQPITITSLRDDTVIGDTNHDGAATTPTIHDWNFETDGATSLDHVDMSYGFFELNISGGSTDVSNSTFTQSINNIQQTAGTFTMRNSSISIGAFEQFNLIGGTASLHRVKVDASGAGGSIRQFGGTLTIDSSEFSAGTLRVVGQATTTVVTGSRAGIVNAFNGTIVDARNNWWGQATGPTGTQISGNVLTIPFLTSDPFVSSVLFLPGIEGSRLYQQVNGSENKRWELTLGESQNDAKALYLSSNGTSLNNIYTKDVVATVNLSLSSARFSILDVYKTFFAQLATLKTNHAIGDYLIFPYDWRLSPVDIVEHGTQYADGVHYLDQELETLAMASPTHKVTIVAHSNGGLVAKALMLKLEREGKANLVDKIILVDVPQLGVVQTIGTMLHGDFNQFPGFILSQANLRGLAENMPDAFALLPSSGYFAKVSDPVIDLTNAPQLKTSAGITTNTITDASSFATFLTNRSKPVYGDIVTPNVLSSALLASSVSLHNDLDAWVPPAGVQVIQIAGWGLDTPKTISYTEKQKFTCSFTATSCALHTVLEHSATTTEDGDQVVVTASEVTNPAWPAYYISIKTANKDLGKNWEHATIVESKPFQDLFPLLLASSLPVTLPQYISIALPPSTGTGRRLRLVVHSPVALDAYDSEGRHTGMVPNPSSDLLYEEEQIPNSYYEEFGEAKYLIIPEDSGANIQLRGLDTGTFTLDVTTLVGDTVSDSTSYVDIPVTTSTTGAFDITSKFLIIDINGSGNPIPVASSTPITDPLGYVRLIKSAIAAMDMDRSVARQLTAKFTNIEHLLKKDTKWENDEEDNDSGDTRKGEASKARFLRKLDKIDAYINRIVAQPARQKNKRGITEVQAEAILNMNNYFKTLIK